MKPGHSELDFVCGVLEVIHIHLDIDPARSDAELVRIGKAPRGVTPLDPVPLFARSDRLLL